MFEDENQSQSSVIKNRKSFHLVRVFVLSRQWQLINFRMHVPMIADHEISSPT